jgi:hypothetical protein
MGSAALNTKFFAMSSFSRHDFAGRMQFGAKEREMGKLSGKMVLALAALLFLFSLGPPPGQAATVPEYGLSAWSGSTGDWNDAGNWNNGVPDSTTAALIDDGGTARISTSDAAALDLTVGQSVVVGPQPPQPSTVLHLDNTLTVGGTLILGQDASGGPGSWQGSYGKYYMSDTGGGHPRLAAGTLIVSDMGYGVFLQQGGTVAVSNDLILGNQILAGDPKNWTYPFSGQYTMWKGATAPNLTVGGQLIVGNAGYGGFEQYSGSVTANQGLVLGSQAGSDGYYFVENDATLTVGQEGSSTTMYVGQGGSGNFALDYYGGTGGYPYSFKLFGDLVVGDRPTGWGLVRQQSGTALVTGNLTLGNQAGASGEYDLFAGSYQSGSSGRYDVIKGTYTGETGNLTTGPAFLNVGGSLTVGQAGTGTFDQEGGSVTVTQDLILGQQNSGNGLYGLFEGTYSDNTGYSQTTSPASLNVQGSLIVGQAGTGTFNQTGGSVSATTITLAQGVGSTGNYNLSGGTVSATSSAMNAIQINGPISSSAAGNGQFNVNGTATVNGNVTNDGTVKTTSANVTWNGKFTNNYACASNTSTQTFVQDLVVTSSGYLVGKSPQDIFIFQANFQNQSTNSANWNTANAEMQFIGGPNGTSHCLYIPGADNGPTGTNPFAWYALDITKQNLLLRDGNLANTTSYSNGALYVKDLTGYQIVAGVVQNIYNYTGLSLNIYYDPSLTPLTGNYTFEYGPGQLIKEAQPIPLPPSVLLLGSGLLGLGLLGWRRKRPTA